MPGGRNPRRGGNNNNKKSEESTDNNSIQQAEGVPAAASDAGAPAAAASSSSTQGDSSLQQQQQQQQQQKKQNQPRQQQQPKQERPKNMVVIPPSKPQSIATSGGDAPETVDCSLCSDPIEAFGVFDCGHFCCYKCALRIRRSFRREPNSGGGNNNNSNRRRYGTDIPVTDSVTRTPCKCHVCRSPINTLTVTETPPANPDSLQYGKTELSSLFSPSLPNVKRFQVLNCSVTSDSCAARLVALISYVCPFPQCWDHDQETGARTQEAFNNLDGLQRHLRTDHNGGRYCDVCVMQGFSFLSELPVYLPSELAAHMKGTNTNKDLAAFGGHPACQFCHNKTLYDGDAMLEHLKLVHYVCDFCNMASYKFIYYNDREALNRHWACEHKICSHPECAQLDESERVFASELELSQHMQSRHGVKTKVSLSGLGFTSAANEITTLPARGSAGGSAAAASAAAEEQLAALAAANQTTLITYDFVGRTIVLPLMPKVAHQQSSSSSDTRGGNRSAAGRRHPPAAKQQQQQNDDAVASTQSTVASPAAVSTPASPAFASPMTTAPGAISFENAVEADSVLRRILQEKLKQHQAKEFQQATVQYLKEQLKAIEYFSKLQKLFPDETVLETVHACLVETLKANKNDLSPAASASAALLSGGDASAGGKDLLEALIQAKSLVLSAEAKRVKEAAAEDEKKRKQAEVRKAHQAVLLGSSKSGKIVLQHSGGGSGGSGGGGNAWLQRTSEKSAAEAAFGSKPQSPASPATAAGSGGAAKKWGPQQAVNSKPSWDQSEKPAWEQPQLTPARPKSPQTQPQLARSAGGAAAAAASSPLLEDAFPGLQGRRPNPKPSQQPKLKGAWKSGRM